MLCSQHVGMGWSVLRTKVAQAEKEVVEFHHAAASSMPAQATVLRAYGELNQTVSGYCWLSPAAKSSNSENAHVPHPSAKLRPCSQHVSPQTKPPSSTVNTAMIAYT